MKRRHSVLNRISLTRMPHLVTYRLDNTSCVCHGSEHSPWLQSIFCAPGRIPQGRPAAQ